MTEHLGEASTPARIEPDPRHTVTDLLLTRVAQAPAHPAFRVRTGYGPTGETVTDVSTEDYRALVVAVAKGLLAAGVRAGDTIGIQGPTGYPWAVADLACLWVGAVVVPIFDSAADDQVGYVVQNARMAWAFAGTAGQRATLQAALGGSPRAGAVWALDFTPAGMGGLIDAGRGVSDALLDERRAVIDPDAPATLVYTSGTEGHPKGVVITHRNLVGQVLNIGAEYDDVVHPGGRTLIFLPLAHVLARGLQLICLAGGMTISYEADPTRAVTALATVHPTFLVVVPRVLQKIRERIRATATSKRLGWLWRQAERTAIAYGRVLQEPGETPGLALRLRRGLYDRLFFARVRALLGGDLDYILCGAAPLGEDLGLLFRGMGVEIVEGYGLTETTAPLTGNRPGDNRCGTVGRPEPGHTVRISAEGEVLARGVGVSPGYWDAADNEGTFVDGFLRTGDLGSLDADGRLTITGRLKEVIVTAGGKTISPQGWQRDVEAEPLVGHAVVVGEGRPHAAALIFLDRDELDRQGLGEQFVPGLLWPITEPRILTQLVPVLERANARVSGPEQVKRYAVYSADLAPGGELVTSTMKLRRAKLLAQMGPAIDDLYARGRELPGSGRARSSRKDAS